MEDEDYGDDEYLDNSDDADIGDILTLPRQREDRDGDDVSVTSDDVISLNDDESYDVIGDRKSSVVDQIREDLEKFRKMRTETEKFKVDSRKVIALIMIIYFNLFMP